MNGFVLKAHKTITSNETIGTKFSSVNQGEKSASLSRLVQRAMLAIEYQHETATEAIIKAVQIEMDAASTLCVFDARINR